MGQARLFGVATVLAVGTAILAGATVAGLAFVCCWVADGSARMRGFLLVILTAAWAVPGPVAGIGLKELVMDLPAGPWLGPLYYGPSPLPIIWANVIRFLPPAVFFLWPVMRLRPRELTEAAQVEGASPLRDLALVAWPGARQAVAIVALAVTALALGEHEAAGRVATPGWSSFIKLLFDQMHYGSDATVAALSILLLGAVLALAALMSIAVMAVRSFTHRR